MEENDYTLYEYFVDKQVASMIGPNGSTSTAWDYVGILCNRYSLLALERHCMMPAQNATTIFKPLLPNPLPTKPLFTWCDIMLTRTHHHP